MQPEGRSAAQGYGHRDSFPRAAGRMQKRVFPLRDGGMWRVFPLQCRRIRPIPPSCREIPRGATLSP
ncbi:hypothetical protein RHCRD62_40380 [Rhodococcus sp. RD6.2]|nr:hypothetical protein RHCRD62_40380 [Rhodococcus sp. RD6.2]